MRPGLFDDQLDLRPNIASRRDIGKTDTLKVPFARTVTHQRSFLVTGCNFWDSLPFKITFLCTLSEFKEKCTLYLLNQESSRLDEEME